VYKVSQHGKLPAPNNEDYSIDPNMEINRSEQLPVFQEDALEGSFEVDLTKAIGMELDNERVVH